MLISIIIPVYNEEETVALLIQKVKSVKISGYSKEIVVINDGSTDTTDQILTKINGISVIKHNKNKGKGASVRDGINNSSGDVILIQDADLEYDPNDYQRLIKPIRSGESKVVYGSRLRDQKLILFGDSKTPLPIHFVVNKILSALTRFLYGGTVSDMETCYKVFTREAIKNIDINADRFDFEPEITAKILKKGLVVHEVTIKVKPRGYKDGKKISWRDGIMAVWTLVKYRFVD